MLNKKIIIKKKCAPERRDLDKITNILKIKKLVLNKNLI